MSISPRVEGLLRAGRAERPPEGNEERLLAGLRGGAGVASGVSFAGTMRLWLRGLGVGLLLAAVATTSAWAIGARGPRLANETSDPGGASFEHDEPAVVAPVTLEGRSQREGQSPVTRAAPVRPARQVTRIAPDELTAIRSAKLALRRGDSSAALAALREHARVFPHGMFREEAAALLVEAYAAAGRKEEARFAADAFEATYRGSPYGDRVRRGGGQ
jgi:TolA-binding protein